MTSPGWDTNPSQVSYQQTLVLIYLPQKDGKLSWLRRKRRLHKYLNLGKAGNRTGDLVVGRQRSYQLRQPRPPHDEGNLSISKIRISEVVKHLQQTLLPVDETKTFQCDLFFIYLYNNNNSNNNNNNNNNN